MIISGGYNYDKSYKENLAAIIFLFALVITGIIFGKSTMTAEASTGLNMNGTTIRGYAYTNNNFTVYNKTGSGKEKIGTCFGSSDYIKIYGVGQDGWSYISYPKGKVYQPGYCRTSYLFQNPDFSGTTGKVQSNITTYKKSNCASKYGTTTKRDAVFLVGYANGNTQILYPCSSYYKVAWVKGKYQISNGKFVKVTSYNPEGCLDSVTSTSTGKITVKGWALDRDNLSAKLEIHVYVGGQAGNGAPGYAITANKYRSDVNKAYSETDGNYHGFSSTISVSKTGTQTVYVYAINTGGGSNVFLGTKTVTIKGQSTSSYKGKMTLSQLKQKFPNGKYWNHAGNPGASSAVNNQDGYTSTPCKKHKTIGTSSQTCNGFTAGGKNQLSWQCMGFAEKLAYDFTGYNPRNNANGWQTSYSSSTLNTLKPGDVVRFQNGNHSILITGVNGETVTYADCNSDGHCKIRWGVTITKSQLRNTFTYVRIAPYQLQ